MAVAAGILVAGAAVAAVAAEWQVVTAPLTLELPRDHGAHLEHRSEWWYVTGIVEAGHRRFGYQLTFFRRGLDPDQPEPPAVGLSPNQVLAAHVAVADVDNGRLLFAQRARRVAAGLAAVAELDLAVRVEDWRLDRHPDGTLTLMASDLPTGIALDLTLVPGKELVAHGKGGVSAKGPEPGKTSAYLSWTRLATTGSIQIGGKTLQVTGESWLDHEWGTSQLGQGVVGWDWLGLRLADGRELMLYQLRQANGTLSSFSSGTLVSPDGSSRTLGASDFTLAPLATWRSRETGAHYPVTLHIAVPDAGLDLRVTPMLANAEIDARATTGVIYWEGPVTVTGTTGGEGYMELTGYATSLANWL